MIAAGDVISFIDAVGYETVYLLLGRVELDGLPPVARMRWECLVLHRDDDVWPRGRPGHVVWPSEHNLLQGKKLS